MNVQEAKKMIDEWVGQDVLLTKEEDGDIDKTVVSLENVSFDEGDKSIDGYVSPVALQLHGAGYVITANDQKAPLPSEAYDIPLTDRFHIHVAPDKLSIETERAIYVIDTLNNQQPSHPL